MKVGFSVVVLGILFPLLILCCAPIVNAQTDETEAGTSYLCSEAYCKEEVIQNPCKELPKQCNETNGGIKMLDPSFCNCCDYCLVYLEEGEDCVYDGLGQTLHESICGPGLGCDEETSTCVSLDTTCIKLQQAYDVSLENGTWGFTQVRPLCDERGHFYPVHCIGTSICYCINPDGERIFGEAVYSSPSVAETMDCECSLAAWKAEQLASEMGVYTEPVHCLEDGSYDLLQCNDNMCQCLDSETKIPDTEARAILEINIMEGSPECFDPTLHEKGKYKRECEEKLQQMLLEIESLKEEGITAVGVRLPDCQYDGRYSRVMVKSNEKWCVNPDGELLEDYIIYHNSTLYEGMDCNCARTRWILQEEGLTELPTCCDNGSFREMQCRRGKCYCVDCNGNQLDVEVNEDKKDTLYCKDTSESCAKCPKTEVRKSDFVLDWDPKDDDEYLMSDFLPSVM